MDVQVARNMVAGDISDTVPFGACNSFRVYNGSSTAVVMKMQPKQSPTGQTLTLTFPPGIVENPGVAINQIFATGSSNLMGAGVQIALLGTGV